MQSNYIKHTNIEMEKSLTVIHNCTGNTSTVVKWDATLNVEFQPDEVIVDTITYRSNAELAVYVITADFSQSLRQSYVNAGGLNDYTFVNCLGTVVDGESYSPKIHIPIRSPIPTRTTFTMESVTPLIDPVGVVAITLRFIKYLPKK